MKFIAPIILVNSLALKNRSSLETASAISATSSGQMVEHLQKQFQLIQKAINADEVSDDIKSAIKTMIAIITNNLSGDSTDEATVDGGMRKLVRNAHDNDLDAYTTEREARVACNTDFESYKTTIDHNTEVSATGKTEWNTCTSANAVTNANHKICSDGLPALEGDMKDACAASDAIFTVTVKVDKCYVECNHKNEEFGDCIHKGEIKLRSVMDNGIASAKAAHATKLDVCEKNTDIYEAEVLRCQGIIDSIKDCSDAESKYRTHLCNVYNAQIIRNSRYTTCVASLGSTFEEYTLNYKAEAERRKYEWKSIMKLLCFLETYEQNPSKQVDEATVESCESNVKVSGLPICDDFSTSPIITSENASTYKYSTCLDTPKIVADLVDNKVLDAIDNTECNE